MCLIAFAWRQAGQRLLLLANRDEFHARPTQSAAFWDTTGHPELLAGKDLEAGGTWLGVTRQGRFAALTNIRSPGARAGLRSRGELVAGFLESNVTPQAYLSTLAGHCEQYGGFNLITGDRDQLWFLHSLDRQPRPLTPGIYGLSNASLDTPWPKLAALKTRLRETPAEDTEQLLTLLADPHRYPDEQLPQTGISPDWERALSAAFIVGENYGTRASTLLRITDADHVEFIERGFGPNAAPLGTVRYEFDLEDWS